MEKIILNMNSETRTQLILALEDRISKIENTNLEHTGRSREWVDQTSKNLKAVLNQILD